MYVDRHAAEPDYQRALCRGDGYSDERVSNNYSGSFLSGGRCAVRYHHAPSLSSIPVPCNLVCFMDKLVQPVFTPNAIDKDFVKTLGIDFEDLEDLRNVVMQKSEVLIAELA